MSKTYDEAEILARIEAEESSAYGINDSELSDARALALKYYNGEPFGNEIEGRSQVVSRDVLDVIESALPQLLKVFVSGDQVVKFEPKGPEDEAAAEQETDYVNHVVMEKNPGFKIFYSWFKDALLSKNGYVKAYYEEEDEVEAESYQGLTDGQLQMLLQDENITVLEHTETPDTQAIQAAQMQAQGNPEAMQQLMAQPTPMLHDVKIQITERRGCIEICNVAPEDIMVSMDCREVSVQEARFVQHRVLMSRDELEEQDWDIPADLGFTDDLSNFEESIARDQYNEQSLASRNERDDILVRDTYIRIDGELKRYVVAGGHILHSEDAEVVPFAVITPHIMPHRHVGMSYSDLTEDVQLIKSSLIRSVVDNQHLLNNGRHFISDRVNLDDMLTSRPGGVVRVTGNSVSDAAQPIINAPLPPTSFSLIEYFDSIKEKRTGITAYNQGMDADSLNKTATGVSQIMNAAQQRLELVARTFAETGVKELFMLVHRMVRTHYTKPDVVRLRNKWVDVDPRQWKSRTDMTITVGLGTGNKDQQLAHLGNIYQMQMGALQIGLPIVRPENIYHTLKQIATNAGFKQSEQFVTDPAEIPPQQPQPDPKIELEKAKLQADAQKFQAETQIKQQEAERTAQLDIQKFQAQAEIDRRQAEQMAQQELARSQNDITIEREKIQAQMALEKFKAELKAQTDIQIATINAEIKAREMAQQAQVDAQRADLEYKKHEATIAAMNKPKTVKRDSSGRVSGVE